MMVTNTTGSFQQNEKRKMRSVKLNSSVGPLFSSSSSSVRLLLLLTLGMLCCYSLLSIWRTTTLPSSSSSTTLLLVPSSTTDDTTKRRANQDEDYISSSSSPDLIRTHDNILKHSTAQHNTNENMKLSSMTRQVCLNTRHLFESAESIEAAYKSLEEFHNGGGNLKVIESYLNDNMDETLRLLNITFTPVGSDKPLPPGESISKVINKLLIQNDKRKRRGYDQRHMPGLYQPLYNKALRGRRNRRMSFDVIEPTSYFSRWKHGLGPIPNLCKYLDVIRPIGGKKEQSFEEKFMCSILHNNERKDNNSTSTSHQIKNATIDSVVLARSMMNAEVNLEASEGTTLEQGKEEEEDKKKTASSLSCQMISIGSNGEWGFENSVIASTDCVVHTFDCTVLRPSKPVTDSIHFYPYCISAEHNKIGHQEFITYSQIVEKANLPQPPVLLKIDVEGFEYDVFTQMLKEAQEKNLKHLLPQQISVELHYSTRMYDLPWHMRFRQAGEIALFAGLMYRQGGYVIVHVKYIRGCDSCAEVLFVRVFCD